MTPVSLIEWSFAALVALIVFSCGACVAYHAVRFVWASLTKGPVR